jgi:hypothetical protein
VNDHDTGGNRQRPPAAARGRWRDSGWSQFRDEPIPQGVLEPSDETRLRVNAIVIDH